MCYTHINNKVKGYKMKNKMIKYTTKDFEKEFPTDDACLEWL